MKAPSHPKKRMPIVRSLFSLNWRLSLIFATAVCGALVGVVATVTFGTGFKSATYDPIPLVGRIEFRRLPQGARVLNDIKTFSVRMDGADDYGRIFINNYLVQDTEDRARVVGNDNDENTDKGDKDRREVLGRLVRQRNDYMVGGKDVHAFLRAGKNYVVVELENSISGTCATGADIVVNGVEIEHFPEAIPVGFDLEKELSNSDLLKHFTSNDDTYAAEPELTLSALSDALCARRIYEFDIEP